MVATDEDLPILSQVAEGSLAIAVEEGLEYVGGSCNTVLVD